MIAMLTCQTPDMPATRVGFADVLQVNYRGHGASQKTLGRTRIAEAVTGERVVERAGSVDWSILYEGV